MHRGMQKYCNRRHTVTNFGRFRIQQLQLAPESREYLAAHRPRNSDSGKSITRPEECRQYAIAAGDAGGGAEAQLSNRNVTTMPRHAPMPPYNGEDLSQVV